VVLLGIEVEELGHFVGPLIEKDRVGLGVELEEVVVKTWNALPLETSTLLDEYFGGAEKGPPLPLIVIVAGAADEVEIGPGGAAGDAIPGVLGGLAMTVGADATTPVQDRSQMLVWAGSLESGGAGLASGGIYGSDTGLGPVKFIRPPPRRPPPFTVVATAPSVERKDRETSTVLQHLLVVRVEFAYQQQQCHLTRGTQPAKIHSRVRQR
jgi:hypothetical protein